MKEKRNNMSVVNRGNGVGNEHVKFISYTGKYPNLCSGILTLDIDGEKAIFGYDDYFSKEKVCMYEPFWSSGGDCRMGTMGEWEIDYKDLPEKFRKYADEIDRVFNQFVEWGCCGGCR